MESGKPGCTEAKPEKITPVEALEGV